MDDSQRKLGAEFVGTFALIFFGAGSALQGADLVGQALANGLAIGLMVTAVGHISGGHFNPAVTLSMLVTGRISPAEALRYWVSQLAGGDGGGTRAARDLPVGRDRRRQPRRPGGRRPRHQHGQRARGRDRGHVLPRLRHLRRRRRQARCVQHPRRPADRPHIAIGVLAVGVVSGAAFNPARWFGPALVSGTFDNFWVWILGPAIGAVARGPRLRPATAQGHTRASSPRRCH